MQTILKKVPLFSSFSDDELNSICELSYEKHCEKDSIIVLEAEKGDTFFVLLRGKVKISIHSKRGKEVIFSVLHDGDFFGDMSLLDGKPRSARVVALEDSTLRLLRRKDFFTLIEEHPQITIKLLEELSKRLRKADERIEGLVFLDVTGRLAGIFLELLEDCGIETEKGVLIKNRPTHQELANMAGTTRETVSRILKQLENQNYISIIGKDLHIHNPEILKRQFYL